jgi:hypothetical protein
MNSDQKALAVSCVLVVIIGFAYYMSDETPTPAPAPATTASASASASDSPPPLTVSRPSGSRYVTLARKTPGFLNINEIEVFGPGGVKYHNANIMPSVSNIKSSPGPSFGPAYLVDGDKSDASYAETATGSSEWVKLDLRENKEITKVVVTNHMTDRSNIIGSVLTLTDDTNVVKFTSPPISTVASDYTFII